LRGFSGATVLRRPGIESVEIEVLTWWTSMAAIRRFAGSDAERAVVEPEVRAALKRFDRRVYHYRVAFEARTELGRLGRAR
jgi:heme-degrading monooxygenase HmoA